MTGSRCCCCMLHRFSSCSCSCSSIICLRPITLEHHGSRPNIIFLGSPLLRAIIRRNFLVTKIFQQKLSRSGSFKIYVYCNKQKKWCDSFTQRTQLREQMTLNTLLTGKPYNTYYDACLPASLLLTPNSYSPKVLCSKSLKSGQCVQLVTPLPCAIPANLFPPMSDWLQLL